MKKLALLVSLLAFVVVPAHAEDPAADAATGGDFPFAGALVRPAVLSVRAPGGAAGAKTRLAAFRAFYAGAKALDVSALPKDAARAHANFLAAMRPVGRAMQSLADAGAKGPAAFLAAAQAAQGELSSLEQTAKTAARQLKDALRRAGADVSALNLEIAD